MPSQKRNIGDIGEKEATCFLEKNGFKILSRNFRIKNIGEIDIIAQKNNKLTFFEVKTRSVKHEITFPIEFSINEKKKRNLNKICQLYLMQNKISQSIEWQIDAIFVKVDTNDQYRIEHLENILWQEYY